MSELTLSVVPFQEVPTPAAVWQRLVLESPEAWVYHTYANLDFNLCAGQKFAAKNESFFVRKGGEIVGAAPLIVQNLSLGGYEGSEAGTYSGPLPWPFFAGHPADLPELENFAFDELESRARAHGAGRIRVRFAPLTPLRGQQERLANIVLGRRYLHAPYQSHLITLGPDTLSKIRERYRRYHRKFSPLFEVFAIDGPGVTGSWEQAYFELHVKDAGGQFRSRESYTRMADLARGGEAFFVACVHKETRRPAGMLLVSLYKAAAYDNSVGVDPEFRESYVSHLMKWVAIEELLRRGARTYELGPRAGLPGALAMTTPKQRGITYFKEGWARDGLTTGHVIEKILDPVLLDGELASWRREAGSYFGFS